MAPATRMKITGIDLCRFAMADLSQSVQKSAVQKALIDAAQPMVDDAASRVPVAEGDLKRAVTASAQIVPNQRKYVKKARKDLARAFVGPNYSRTSKGKGYAPHAHLVEFGTKPRWHKATRKYVGQAPAQPYMRPAFDAGKSAFIDRFAGSLLLMIEKAKKRIARKNARSRK